MDRAEDVVEFVTKAWADPNTAGCVISLPRDMSAGVVADAVALYNATCPKHEALLCSRAIYDSENENGESNALVIERRT